MKFWSNLSLRIRLTLLFVGLLAMLLCIFGVIYYQDTRNLLIETMASNLRARAKPTIEHWLYGKPMFTEGKKGRTYTLKKIAPFLARDLTSRKTVALVLDRYGKVLANGKWLPEEPDPVSPVPRYVRLALGGKNEVTYVTRHEGTFFLVILIPLRTSPGDGKVIGLVQINASLASLQNVMRQHGMMMILVAILTLAIGAFLGLLMVSSSLGGLKRMVETCQAISEGKLDHRVNLPDRGDEIGKLAGAFDGMVEQIERTVESQRRFVANAAHELKSPLTALRGSIEVLLRGVQDDPIATARLVQGMYREVTRFSNLCERLLDLSRMEGIVSLHKRPVVLRDVMREFLPQLQKMAASRVMKLEVGPHVTLSFDPDMFRQVLFNLVQNAVAHTEVGEEIVVGWRLVSNPEGVLLWVKDHGEGISEKDLPHVFEPFYQGASRLGRETKSGTGLGLSIVKAIMTAHHGEIEIESTPGVGTRVMIRIPFE